MKKTTDYTKQQLRVRFHTKAEVMASIETRELCRDEELGSVIYNLIVSTKGWQTKTVKEALYREILSGDRKHGMVVMSKAFGLVYQIALFYDEYFARLEQEYDLK